MSVQSPAATREGAIDPRLRWRLHLLPLAAAVFLSVYGKVVCEFIATIALAKVLFGLAAVALFQVILREAMFRTWPSPRGRRLPRPRSVSPNTHLQGVAQDGDAHHGDDSPSAGLAVRFRMSRAPTAVSNAHPLKGV